MKTYVCPNTEICPVYKNWVKEKNDNRLDIIIDHVGYHCLALDAIYDEETGIKDNGLIDRIRYVQPECTVTRTLNMVDRPQ